MASRGKGARAKGGNFERAIAQALSEATGLTWERGLAQTRGGGAEVPDVTCAERTDIHIECKCQKRPNIKAALAQALEDKKETALPIVITKEDRQATLVTMRLDDWLPLFKLYLNATKTTS